MTRKTKATILAASAVTVLTLAAAPPMQKASGEHWVATWATAEQLAVTGAANGRGAVAASGPVVGIVPAAPAPPPPPPGTPQRRFPIPPTLAGLNNQTVRMIVRTSLGGSRIRVRL